MNGRQPNPSVMSPARVYTAFLAGAVAALFATILFPAGALAVSSSSRTATFPSATIALFPTQGTVGTNVTATISSFPPDSTIAFYIDQPGTYLAGPDAGAPTTGHDGMYRLDFAMPDQTYGAHQVCADTGYPGSTEPYKVRACAQFNIEARLTVDPATDFPGARLSVVGTGFPAYATAALYIEPQGNEYFGTPGPAADNLGRFQETNITWPVSTLMSSDPTTPGPHSICANTGWDRPGTGVKACATFTVKALSPSIELNPSSGQLGTELTIKASGFPPSTRYGISIDNLRVICDRWTDPGPELGADATGAFTTQIGLFAQMSSPCYPAQTMSLTTGRHKVCAQVGTFNACGYFTLLGEPTAVPSPSGGAPPTAVPSPSTGATPPPVPSPSGGSTPPWIIAALVTGGLGIATSIALGTVLWMRGRLGPGSTGSSRLTRSR